MAKKKKQQEKENREMWIALAIFSLIVLALICVIVIGLSSRSESTAETTEAEYETPICPFEIDGFETVESKIHGAINEKLSLTCIGKYSGGYFEDSSNEAVTDVLAILVENTSDIVVEFAEIKINCGEEDAFFEIHALPAGSSALILESRRMQYQDYMDFRSKICFGFTEADTSFAEDFQIRMEENEIEITNLSDRDLTSPITVYYKTQRQDGLFLGGIAYRAVLEGGLACGQAARLPSEHLELAQVIYVDCDG